MFHTEMTRALIVEDNDTFRQTLRKMLSNNFPTLTLDEARDGTEALDLIGTSCPDLIFMDIKLPGENGLQITKKIRGLYNKAKIIILTSHDYPEYREAARNYGASHFISKGS
ncbi:MAG: response regulator transcription factor, partial [Pseudomonadota bacterium]